MSKKKRSVDSIVEPAVKFDGDTKPHPLVTAMEEGLEIKGVGYAGIPGTRDYVSYVIHAKGKEVVKIEAEEPNMRSIAEEATKIAFVSTFMDAEV
jgi:H2-forming N5,N10-methylenetetrahydromethanopterin dehydrogenase-like enzyme